MTTRAMARMARRRGEEFVYTRIFDNPLSTLRLPGPPLIGAGNHANVLATSALQVATGDQDLRIRLQKADYSLTTFEVLMNRAVAAAVQSQFLWRMENTGLLRISIASGGSFFVTPATAPVSPSLNGQLIWLRCTVDIDDGAGNHVVSFFTSVDEEASFQLVGLPIVVPGALPSVNTGFLTTDLEIGGDDIGSSPLTADVYRATLRIGINGAVYFDARFQDEAPGTTNFADSASGLGVTIFQNGPTPAAIIDVSRDTYEDVVYTADESPPRIRGIRVDKTDDQVLLPTGEVREVDLAVLVAFPLLDSNGKVVVIQDDVTERAATLTDGAGRLYKVLEVGHEGENTVGATRLLCVRQADS